MASYYIRKIRESGWSLMEQKFVDGKRSQKTVPMLAFEELGFRWDMTIEEAQRRAKEINAIGTLKSKPAAVVAAAKRLEHIKKAGKVLIPEHLANRFTQYLADSNYGTEDNYKRQISHWKLVQEMLIELEIEPHEFIDNKDRIFKYFIKHEISFDYARKLLRILNLWGKVVCKDRGQFYDPLPNPKGLIRAKIVDTYTDSDSFRGASLPLTPKLLERMREDFEHLPGQYAWLYVSVWFGLRPIEIDRALKEKNHMRVEFDEERKIKVLWIYQSKLTSVPRDQRWKPIPIITKEQEKALGYLMSGELKRPLSKTVQSKSGNERVRLYGGRKAFDQLMKDLGQDQHNISVWMGHRTISTTKASYTDNQAVRFTPIKKAKKKK